MSKPIIEILAAIDGGHFHAGIVLWNNRVVEAAPIVKYMAKQRWTRARVRSHCAEKGWQISIVHQLERQRP